MVLRFFTTWKSIHAVHHEEKIPSIGVPDILSCGMGSFRALETDSSSLVTVHEITVKLQPEFSKRPKQESNDASTWPIHPENLRAWVQCPQRLEDLEMSCTVLFALRTVNFACLHVLLSKIIGHAEESLGRAISVNSTKLVQKAMHRLGC